jgi:hypothetical protein
VSDHAPFGSAAESLALRFGVDFGKGYVYDNTNRLADGPNSALIFSRANGLLGEHAIVAGRDSAERVRTVVSFTGQSMSVPEGATALLRFAPTAREAPTRETLRDDKGIPVPDRAQGIALPFGRGRVVVLGEAAMLSAQLAGPGGFLMGMNHPGSDDKQFALNVMRWLSRALD